MSRKLLWNGVLLFLLLLIINSCRNDHLQDLHYQEESTKTQLVSRIISLNESVHKHKLLPQLKTAKENIKTTMPGNLFGKTVSFGDSISIDTEHVIYIANGPNYHTYTFSIERSNPSPNDPIENLLLTPLPDGTYKEFWMTYNFTEQEKEQIRSGKLFDYAGKVSVKELSKGSFSGSVLQKVVCGYSIGGYYTWCSEGLHNNGKPCNATEYYSEYIIEVSYSCYDDLSPGGDGGGASGEGGDGNGGGTNGDTNCTSQGSYLEPEDPSLPPTDNCNSGVPTLPNLGTENPRPKNPCQKIQKIGKHDTTKQLFEQLKPKTQLNAEVTTILNENEGQIEISAAFEGGIGQAGIDIAIPAGAQFDGVLHSHYIGLFSIFSAPDLASISQWYKNGHVKNINNFIFGVVADDNENLQPEFTTQYVMVIDNAAKFDTFASGFITNGQIDKKYTNAWGEWNFRYYNILQNGSVNDNELGFVKLLEGEKTGLKILKGSNNSNDWAELTLENGQIKPIPCN